MLRSRLLALIALVLVILPLLAMDKHVVANDFDIADTSGYNFSAQDDTTDPELIMPAGISVPIPNRHTVAFRSLSFSYYRNPDYATPLRPPCA